MYDDLLTLREKAITYTLIEDLDEANPELCDFAYMVFTITDGILGDIIKEQGGKVEDPDNLCSKCHGDASEDYMIDGECVCEDCYFEFVDEMRKDSENIVFRISL